MSEQAFVDLINKNFAPFEIFGQKYRAGDVLCRIDPIAIKKAYIAHKDEMRDLHRIDIDVDKMNDEWAYR